MDLSDVQVCGGIGLAMVFGGSRWGLKHYRIFHAWQRTQGKVVAWHKEQHRTSYFYFPVVEFSPETGTPVRFRGAAGTACNINKEWETGAVVKVLYDPTALDEAKIYNFTNFWLGPLGFTGIGLSLIIIPLILFLRGAQ